MKTNSIDQHRAQAKALAAATSQARAYVATFEHGGHGVAYLQAKRAREQAETAEREHAALQPRLQATNPKGVTLAGPFSALEALLLRIHGGGMTASQTAQAMADGERVRQGDTVRRYGWKLETVPALSATAWGTDLWPV